MADEIAEWYVVSELYPEEVSEMIKGDDARDLLLADSVPINEFPLDNESDEEREKL